jgi:hypothetical protein
MGNFSDVKIFTLSTPAGSMVGSGSLVYNGVIRLSFTIMKGSQGIFASLPSTKGKKPDAQGKIPYYPQVKFLTDELYAEFQNEVKKEFAKKLSGGNTPKTPTPPIGEEPQVDYSDSCPF